MQLDDIVKTLLIMTFIITFKSFTHKLNISNAKASTNQYTPIGRVSTINTARKTFSDIRCIWNAG